LSASARVNPAIPPPAITMRAPETCSVAMLLLPSASVLTARDASVLMRDEPAFLWGQPAAPST
ncbi:hypothetical protein ACIPIA_15230, partial [Bosea sp. CER48]|uniref:hypothetical protein n=1 Tax=Bosea sp. CER48 TaxID=3377035 RepID=UPI00380437B4